jgi:DNA-binding FrmR family transcriptional regulator
MVEADTPCPEVLVQLAAVNAAVQKAARIVLEDHISSCLVQAAKDGSASAEWRKLKDALDRYIR